MDEGGVEAAWVSDSDGDDAEVVQAVAAAPSAASTAQTSSGVAGSKIVRSPKKQAQAKPRKDSKAKKVAVTSPPPAVVPVNVNI